MSGVLLFLAGAALGATVAWFLAGRRFAAAAPIARGMLQGVPPMPDDLVGSETATYLAANISAESTFEPLAYVLIERCSLRVNLPAALVMRERAGAPAAITAVAGGLDNRLLGHEVPLDSPAGRAITEGLPIVGSPDEKVVTIQRGDRRRYEGGGVAVPHSSTEKCCQ